MPDTETTKESVIVEANGNPNAPDRLGESNLWARFKLFLFKRLPKGDDLIEAYTTAERRIRESEARKNVQKATELAAEADLKRQQATKEFQDNVDRVFSDDGLPPAAKKLKLAKLIESNPDLEKQLDKVEKIIERLSTKGGIIQIVQDPQALPETNGEGDSQ
jgi:hypothetical protein